MTPCPCGSEKNFDECCGPIIAGAISAPDAEALVRSRYSAFVHKVLDHVERTNAPEVRDDFNRAEAERMSEECEWQNLKIRRVVDEGETAQVEFTVWFRHDQKDMYQTELSSFRRENGEWFYVSGELNPKQIPFKNENKVGRNDPCPCGSGKKVKNCCGTDAWRK